jgi:hypothetical protein
MKLHVTRTSQYRLAVAALLAVSAAAFAPTAAQAQARVDVVIGAAPPAPVYERVPAPRHGYIWSQGHWEWNGHKHFWVPGVWIAERPGYAYTAPVWIEDHGHWVMRPARWEQHGGPDRNHDGIPDRFEHGHGDRDHDGVPDRFEHGHGDRDHDGVPDRFDRSPDNPRRN